MAGWPLDLPSQSVDLGVATDALITDAISLINFLRAINATSRDFCLYTEPALRQACRRYNHYWLPLQRNHEKFITPPLDVHWVLYCRLLSSSYDNPLHRAELLPRLGKRKKRIAYWDKNGEKLWTSDYPNEPFDCTLAVSTSHDLDRADEELFEEVKSVARCQQVFYQHVCLSHFKSARYLYCAYIRLVQFRSLHMSCAIDQLPPDLRLLETVLKINGTIDKPHFAAADSNTVARAWQRKFSETKSPFLHPNEQFWHEFRPRNFGYFDILTEPRPTVTTVKTTQPPIWMNFSTKASRSKKTIYHFEHILDQFNFQAHCSEGVIELYDASENLVSYAKLVPSHQPLSQYQCSISRRRQVESETFDGEPLIQTDSDSITIAVWNSAGLSMIVQLRNNMLDTFERSEASQEWTKRAKRIRLTPTCNRRQPDQYHLCNGTIKCNWAVGIVTFVVKITYEIQTTIPTL